MAECSARPSRHRLADVVERVRMAVAEAGSDPSAIVEPEWPGQGFGYNPDLIPARVVWMAREVDELRRSYSFWLFEAVAVGLLRAASGFALASEAIVAANLETKP